MTKFKFLGVAIAALVSNFAWAGHGPCFDMDPVACQTFSLTNVERLKANLPPVSYSPICFSMAQEQSADMADRNYFDHQRPAFPDRPAESFSQRAARFDLSRGVGENIAMAQTPAQAMELWMKSPGHRQNILNPGFRSMGVGYKSGLFTQTFSN